ncbi:extracellular solute-binding protein [Propionibacteriaceae bacterium Y2011]
MINNARGVSRDRGVSRRAVLGGAAAVAAGGMLAACAPGTEQSGGTGGSTEAGGAGAGASVPAYVPFPGIEHDLPGTAEGIPPGVYSYPDPPIVRDGYPLPAGDPISALVQGPPNNVPDSENQNFQNIVKQIGAPLQMVYGGYPEYTSKFQVTMASGDLPDMCMIVPVAELPRLLEANFTDLSDVLGGDGVSKYPGLANIPTAAWSVPTINGRLFGIPMPLPPAGKVITARSDTVEARGVDPHAINLRDGQDFLDLLEQLTRREKNEFSMGANPTAWLLSIVKQMVGGPNVWKLDGDTFVHENETEEMKEALERSKEIIAAGYLHPNSFSDPGNNGTWWTSGVTALYIQGFSGWTRQSRFDVDWEYINVEVPAWDGGAAPVHKSSPAYEAFMAFKQAEGERLEQMLQVADFLASPFGTQQFVDLNYGVETYSYEMRDGEPMKLEEAPQVPTHLRYCGGNYASVLYGAGNKEYVDAQHDYVNRVIPDGLDNPAGGLYSETEVTKAATMTKEMLDVQRSIMQGEKPLTAWDEFVSEWKSKVGDQMAAEYAEAKANS